MSCPFRRCQRSCQTSFVCGKAVKPCAVGGAVVIEEKLIEGELDSRAGDAELFVIDRRVEALAVVHAGRQSGRSVKKSRGAKVSAEEAREVQRRKQIDRGRGVVVGCGGGILGGGGVG